MGHMPLPLSATPLHTCLPHTHPVLEPHRGACGGTCPTSCHSCVVTHRWPVAVGEEDRLFTTSCFQLMKVIICSALMNVFLSCTQTHMVGKLVWVRNYCGVCEWSSVFVSKSTVGGVLVLSPLLLLVVEVLTSAWSVKRLAQLCFAGQAYSTPDWWRQWWWWCHAVLHARHASEGLLCTGACVCKVLVG